MRLVLQDGLEVYYNKGGDTHVQIPVGWDEQHDPDQARPEWKPKIRGQNPDEEIFEGDHSASGHVSYATHDAFLYRNVVVEIGPVTAGAWFRIDCHSQAGHGVRIGVSPDGESDPYAADVEWSGWWSSHMDTFQNREWVYLEVEDVQPVGHLITVFLHTRNDHAHEWASVMLDDVRVWDHGTSGDVTVEELQAVLADVDAARAKLTALIERIGDV